MTKKKQYQPDTVMKDFFRDTDRFIDIVNGFLFQGLPIVDDAIELDSEQATTTRNKSVQSRRDLIKIVSIDGKAVIIGIENQQTRDKNMIYRDMEYTSLKYNIRLKDKRNEICPIITLVIYCGKYKWNYETELIQMMKIPHKIDKYINNWKTIVIDAKKVNISLLKNKDVRDFFEGIQKIYQWKNDNNNILDKDFTYETAFTIGVVTGTEVLIDKAKRKAGGTINMKNAINDALKEREIRGRDKGKVEAKLEAIRKVMEKLHLDEEKAMDFFEIPLNERYIYISALQQHNS